MPAVHRLRIVTFPTTHFLSIQHLLHFLGSFLEPVRVSLPSMLSPVHDQAAICGRQEFHLTTGSCPSLQPRGRVLLPFGKLRLDVFHDRAGIR